MSQRDAFLKEMGVGPVWVLRERDQAARVASDVPAIFADDPLVLQDDMPCFDDIPPMDDIPPGYFDVQDDTSALPQSDISAMNWESLEETIRQCRACGLCEGRTQAVPGVGDRNADWLFVGEGPGYFEDQQGEPFVGKSGQLLDNMLLTMGLKRGNRAYIANVVKCHPTDSSGKDRPPTPAEAATCRPYLDRQIALIRPKIIVALGRVASTTLLGSEPQTPLAVLRGTVHAYRTPDGADIPLVATYHPAYLLRQLADKRKAWEDLCMAMAVFSGIGKDSS